MFLLATSPQIETDISFSSILLIFQKLAPDCHLEVITSVMASIGTSIIVSLFYQWISEAQIINNGSYFYGDIESIYNGQIINCDNNTDCIIDCVEYQSCLNATINCPSNPNYGCDVLCINNHSCAYSCAISYS